MIIMMLKPLACAVLSATLLSACSVLPTSKDPIVFKEPALSAPFYALNPFSYDVPPAFEVDLKKAGTKKLIIPATNSKVRNMTYADQAGNNQVDITEIDDTLQMVEGKARHYPPRFASKDERRGLQQKMKQTTQQLDTLAAPDNASFDVLIRAFKASAMARNLDLGAIYTTKSLTYAQRLQKINKEDPELNFWFGFTLSEGGGQREAMPYLDKAMKSGVQEAYLATANNYLAMEQKKNAIQTLKNYKLQYPQEANVADRLINEIEKKGRWNVWQVLTPPTK